MFEFKWGTWLPDRKSRENPGATVAKNVYPAAESYLPVRGFAPTTPPLSGRVTGGITVRDEINDVFVYLGSADKIYQATGALNERGIGYATGSEDRWEFAKWGNQIIATNYADPIQVIGIGGSSFEELARTAPKAKTIAVVRGHLVAGNLNDAVDGVRPDRVHWSGFNDPVEWTPGTNQADFQDLKGNGGWVKKIVGGEFGLVFQERSIWRMTYIGAPYVFQFDEIEHSIGTPASGSVVQHGRDVYFLSQDGFYVLKEGTSAVNISAEICSRFFFSDSDKTQYHKITSAVDPVNNLVLWAYQRKDSRDDCLNRILVYNWVVKKWSYIDICVDFIMCSATYSYTLEELDNYTSLIRIGTQSITTLEELPASLDSEIWKGGSIILGGVNGDHQFGYFDGDFLEAVIESKELGGDNHQFLDMVRSFTEGASEQKIEILSRDKLNEPHQSSGEVIPNENGRAYFRVNARYHKVRESISGGFTDAPGGYVQVKDGGTR